MTLVWLAAVYGLAFFFNCLVDIAAGDPVVYRDNAMYATAGPLGYLTAMALDGLLAARRRR